ncbi:hypothetical protein Rwratislav_46000 [Rhodococcus wratislaviensis IFP 2016]|nr:hypothetical protein Rwratislav_46000 [Rhodococcus wratislaviensis IFP 2016]
MRVGRVRTIMVMVMVMVMVGERGGMSSRSQAPLTGSLRSDDGDVGLPDPAEPARRMRTTGSPLHSTPGWRRPST